MIYIYIYIYHCKTNQFDTKVLLNPCVFNIYGEHVLELQLRCVERTWHVAEESFPEFLRKLLLDRTLAPSQSFKIFQVYIWYYMVLQYVTYSLMIFHAILTPKMRQSVPSFCMCLGSESFSQVAPSQVQRRRRRPMSCPLRRWPSGQKNEQLIVFSSSGFFWMF